jgi:hypothetical protein
LIYPLTSKAKEWWEYVVASSDPTGEPEDQECEDEEDESDGDPEGIQAGWDAVRRYNAEYERKWDHYDRKDNRRLRRGIGPPELQELPCIEETMWKRDSISSSDSEDSRSEYY